MLKLKKELRKYNATSMIQFNSYLSCNLLVTGQIIWIKYYIRLYSKKQYAEIVEKTIN